VNDPPESARRNEATVYDWLGQFVIVNYTRGPAWDDINDPFDIARGPLEGRESPFFLQEVSSLGIMVQAHCASKTHGDHLFSYLGDRSTQLGC
jgi:hypothetical protein